MRRAAVALTLALAVPAWGSEPPFTPTGTEAAAAPAKDEVEQPALGGFDVDLTLMEVSGVVFAAEAYENQLALSLDPSFALGKRFFRGLWAEPLTVGAKLLVEHELAGNDEGFRGPSFRSPELLRDVPEAAALAGEGGRVEGATRQARLGDVYLGVSHGEVATLPGEVTLKANARWVFPTSVASRSAGMRGAASASLGAERAFGPVTMRYDAHGALYLWVATTELIAHQSEPVWVNGQPVEPYRPLTTGYTTPSHALVHSLGFELELPREVSVSAEYSLTHTWAHAVSPCQECIDGRELTGIDARGQRDSQSFFAEAAVKPRAWLGLGLGLSTSRPLRATDGRVANPFWHATRDNATTLYLALYVNAEALASSMKPKESK